MVFSTPKFFVGSPDHVPGTLKIGDTGCLTGFSIVLLTMFLGVPVLGKMS